MDRREFLALALEAGAASIPGFGQPDLLPRNELTGLLLDMPLDLREIPLSYAGSYLVLALHDDGEPALPLRLSTVRKTTATYRYQSGSWSHDLLSFGSTQTSGELEVQARWKGVTLEGPSVLAYVSFQGAESLRIKVQRGVLRLVVPRRFGWRVAEGRTFRGFDSASGYIFQLSANESHAIAYRRVETAGDAVEEWTLTAGTDAVLTLEALVEAVPVTPVFRSLAEWMRRCPHFANDDTAEKRKATQVGWYLFWNLQVTPSGGYGRVAILSSKRALSQVWSWDNLFNALAVCRADPLLAWEQLRLVLDHQLANGMLPDTVSDARATFGYTKPPLWGWAVEQLLLQTPGAEQTACMRSVYPSLVRLHRWWFRERDLRGDGVPVYLAGNDSGWDNSTIFDGGFAVQSPDLLAFLLLDAEALGAVAERLGLPGEARQWRAEASLSLALFTKSFVRGDELVYFAQTAAGWQEQRSTSLLTRMPVLLGRRLPPAVLQRLVRELGDPELFAAPCGPSSEALNSPHYEPNGYWRGPVWGPSTYLVAQGLRAAGETALARELGDRYRATCAREATFRENYDARTGAGQFDSGMTWCAADYLLLGEQQE